MDQKRLLAAIAISIGILLAFDLWNRPAREAQQAALQQQQAQQQQPPAAAPPSPGAEQARANIQATQVGPIDEEAEAQESPDDIDLDDDGAGADELLAKHLGAELIGEEEPEL